jgi:hypothetical protein
MGLLRHVFAGKDTIFSRKVLKRANGDQMVTATKDVDSLDFWTRAAIIASQNYRDFILHFSILGLDFRYSALD